MRFHRRIWRNQGRRIRNGRNTVQGMSTCNGRPLHHTSRNDSDGRCHRLPLKKVLLRTSLPRVGVPTRLTGTP